MLSDSDAYPCGRGSPGHCCRGYSPRGILPQPTEPIQ